MARHTVVLVPFHLVRRLQRIRFGHSLVIRAPTDAAAKNGHRVRGTVSSQRFRRPLVPRKTHCLTMPIVRSPKQTTGLSQDLNAKTFHRGSKQSSSDVSPVTGKLHIWGRHALICYINVQAHGGRALTQSQSLGYVGSSVNQVGGKMDSN